MASPQRSVASHVLAVLGVVAVLVVGASVALGFWRASVQVEDAAADQVTDVARTVAASDEVRDALAAGGPTAELTDFAERTRDATGTDFVVVMTPEGVRYTHPNQALVGGTFLGTTDAARRGGIVVEQYTGTLGPSTRAVVPVLDDGRVVGLVSVGIVRAKVSQALWAMWPQMVVPGVVAALVAGTGAWVVARQVRRETLGLNASEVRRLHDHHDALLHAVREGLVIADTSGRVQVINDEAVRLLGLGPDAVGRPVADLGLAPDLAALLVGDAQQVDVAHATGARLLLVSSDAVVRDGRRVATLTTLRDRTELESLTGRLSATQGLADALHARSHEAANRLHTVVTLIELGRAEEAVAFATGRLRGERDADAAILAAIEPPAVAALLLGKSAQASERGVRLTLDPDAHLPAGTAPEQALVTVLGNLIDNALDAVAGRQGAVVEVDAQVDDGLLLTVSDNGPGVPDPARVFERGFTTKDADGPAGRGIGLTLTRQVVEALGGTVTVGRGPGATFEVRLPGAGGLGTTEPGGVAGIGGRDG
ncbi:sensor histidine kinase [Propioniciclava coleopterorum]|uniref:histidine kinase n=1 Tax=Propioniciclava coleopterorum TaxID=2714937 RepID=A0A6G7Y6Q4_9ACTN|nr:sensor histidine kinase [Propioniciclava coleopterorum]QIK72297.1 sensor histidine kinase [Propioniciclava coleopterorum]